MSKQSSLKNKKNSHCMCILWGVMSLLNYTSYKWDTDIETHTHTYKHTPTHNFLWHRAYGSPERYYQFLLINFFSVVSKLSSQSFCSSWVYGVLLMSRRVAQTQTTQLWEILASQLWRDYIFIKLRITKPIYLHNTLTQWHAT